MVLGLEFIIKAKYTASEKENLNNTTHAAKLKNNINNF